MSLHTLGASEKVSNLLKQFGLKKPVISVRPVILCQNEKIDKQGSEGKYWRIPTHQDWYYSMGSLDSLNISISWVPCNKELGALDMTPGSHLWVLMPTTPDTYGLMNDTYLDDQFICLDTEPGDALLFYSILVHRSGTNTTSRLSWSTQFRYNNLYEPTFIKRKFPNPFVYNSTHIQDTPGFPSAEDMEYSVMDRKDLLATNIPEILSK